jgi:hypothetical protein
MDDLKVIGIHEEELRDKIRIARTLSNGIKMEFGLEKCAKISVKRGKEHVEYPAENEIKELETEKAHSYLGLEGNCNIEHKKEKRKIEERVYKKIKFDHEYRTERKRIICMQLDWQYQY